MYVQWDSIRNSLYKEFGSLMFYNLSKFSLMLLSLPVSNADAERLFHKTKLAKTNLRNKLDVSTVKNLILISEAVKEQEACYLFQPSEDMLNCC